ncbi:hypothetical protein PMZ80_002149 [Knufia obscura]|uniref:Haloacid dehalogenase n=2 Tax=Knufia TaxID=430999 RepID=A0AAN8IN86_9EURO|nr:hypothetical protein PMZ80_002149 [Knufia obscura]KAK5953962.1 hypothetical protein OHC33_005234 [Knufia fluminis]
MASTDIPMPTPTVPNKSFTEFKSMSFDIYGTLIDWETSIIKQCQPLLDSLPTDSPYKNATSDSAARQKLAARFNHFEAKVQADKPAMVYDELLEETYLLLAKDLGVDASTSSINEQAKRFGNSVGEWEAFPDTVDAMKRLGKYYKLVPLSNVDRASFSRTASGPLAGIPFWKVYVAEDIGSYKPDLRNFEYLLKRLDEDDKAEGGSGISKEEDLMVAQSLFHDHVPCKKMGMASVWIARGGAGMGMGQGAKDLHERGDVGYGWRFPTLGALADAVEKEWEEKGVKARY